MGKCAYRMLVLLLLAASGGAVLAKDPPPDAQPTLSAPAAAVRTAVLKGDQEALRSLIESEDAHPFPVAHELCVHGLAKVARAYALATDRTDLSPLSAYVSRLARQRPSLAAWRRRAAVLELLRAGGWYDVQQDLADVTTEDLGRDVPSVILLYAKAEAEQRLDDPAKAVPLYIAAAEKAESFGWYRGAVDMLGRAFSAAREARNAADMLDALDRRMDVHMKTGNRAAIGAAMADRGAVQGNLANYTEAADDIRSALRMYGEYLTERDLVQTRANLGLAYVRVGRFAEALDLLEGALDRAKALADEDLVAMAEAYLGDAALDMGDLDAAEAHLKRALDHYEDDSFPLYRAATEGSLGHVAFLRGDLLGARAHWEQAAGIYEAENYEVGRVRAEACLASVVLQEGHAKTAERMFKRALEDLERLNDTVGVCSALDDLARFYRGRNVQLAMKYREKQIEAARKSGSVEEEVKGLGALAWLHVDRGQHREALKAARQAAENLGQRFDCLPTGRAAAARAGTVDIYEAGLAAAVALDDVDEACYFLESGRAGVLLTALEGRGDIRESEVDPELRRDEEAARIHEALARQALIRAKEADDYPAAQEAAALYLHARDRLAQVVAKIQLAGGIAVDLIYPHSLGREEIQSRLADGDVLVSYGTYGKDAIAALVVGQEDARIVPLGSARKADELAAALLDATTSVESETDADGEGEAEGGFDAAPEALREWIVDRLGVPEDARRVLLSPTGRLSYVPPAHLFPDLPVVCVPSVSAAVRLAPPRVGTADEPEGQAAEGVFALGDPTSGVTRAIPRELQGLLATRGASLGRLESAGEEAKAVGTTVLVGDAASETALRAGLKRSRRWRSIHLACHCLVNEDRPTYCALVLAATDQDDGYLNAFDLIRMRVNADLAVLSACDTGRGQLVRAEGIIGLTSAFLVAGAPKVLASLWQVDDAATRALMERFYALWNPQLPGIEPLPAAQALLEAQRFVKGQEKWEHPFYWAGWALWGSSD